MTTDGDGRANRGIPLLDGAPEREQSGKEAPAGDHATTTGKQSALGLLRRTGSAPQTTAVVIIVQPKSGKQQRSSCHLGCGEPCKSSRPLCMERTCVVWWR